MAVGVTIPDHLKKKHVERETQTKRKGWSTPYGFVDFTEPQTHEYACEFMKQQSEYFAKLWESHDAKNVSEIDQ